MMTDDISVLDAVYSPEGVDAITNRMDVQTSLLYVLVFLAILALILNYYRRGGK